ncbi:MAG: glycerol-3-phosphate dehydrogenase/oxidase [Candidatus Poribacteria bacterium]|nr:glycerol-3-phosphate dehydrogenase/oxidase [Candidatus Poribacteria bacterium]MDE0504303.1 glycerol-3-phosphate dehydrogenase/oxidase [Candidatus Poribacteria bacterium]
MPVEFSARTRAQNIQNLQREPLDVLVIGGGIVGAGLIRDLALNGGLRTGLVDKGDFANGTSGATSQLIHGGFRYLIKRDFALIKEARREREILLRIAPNLVKSAPIAILNYKGDPYPLAGMSLAAHYYNHLSKADKAERARTIRDPERIRDLVGPVEARSLKGCVVVWDSMVDDARLTLLTLKDAHLNGALVANYVRFVEFIDPPGKADRAHTVLLEDVLSGTRFEVVARQVVSAAGPWTDRLWEKDPAYDGVPRLTTRKAKGIHLIFSRLNRGDCGIATFTRAEKRRNEKPRFLFTLRFDDALSAVGTTESDPEADPDSVRPSAGEVDYLLSEVNRIFPAAAVNRASIVSAYAGVRPLIAPKSDGFVSREHLITESKSGAMYIYGGKLTTHRKIAEEAVDRIAEELGKPRSCKTASYLLGDSMQHEFHGDVKLIPTAQRERIIGRYGTGEAAIGKFIDEDRTLAEPVSESSPFMKAEVLYAFWGEMAMTLDDLLWRRLRIGFTPGQGVDLAPKIARLLGEKGHWNESKIASEVEAYTKRISRLNAAFR